MLIVDEISIVKTIMRFLSKRDFIVSQKARVCLPIHLLITESMYFYINCFISELFTSHENSDVKESLDSKQTRFECFLVEKGTFMYFPIIESMSI